MFTLFPIFQCVFNAWQGQYSMEMIIVRLPLKTVLCPYYGRHVGCVSAQSVWQGSWFGTVEPLIGLLHWTLSLVTEYWDWNSCMMRWNLSSASLPEEEVLYLGNIRQPLNYCSFHQRKYLFLLSALRPFLSSFLCPCVCVCVSSCLPIVTMNMSIYIPTSLQPLLNLLNG